MSIALTLSSLSPAAFDWFLSGGPPVPSDALLSLLFLSVSALPVVETKLLSQRSEERGKRDTHSHKIGGVDTNKFGLAASTVCKGEIERWNFCFV